MERTEQLTQGAEEHFDEETTASLNLKSQVLAFRQRLEKEPTRLGTSQREASERLGLPLSRDDSRESSHSWFGLLWSALDGAYPKSTSTFSTLSPT